MIKLEEKFDKYYKSLEETYANSKQLYDTRIIIARELNISASSILLNEHGRMDLHNIDEIDKTRITNRLRMLDYCSDIFSSASGYDFNHFDFSRGGMPKQKYNISCLIDFDKIPILF